MKEREKPFAVSPFISDSIWSYMNIKDWKVVGNSFRTRLNSINKVPLQAAALTEHKEGRKRSFSLNNITMYKNILESSDMQYPASPAQIATLPKQETACPEKSTLSQLRRHSLDPTIFNSIAQSAVSMHRNTNYHSNSIVCIVQFGSGSRCFGVYSGIFLVKGVFVIIEADRGENCGSVILEQIDIACINEIAAKYNIHSTEIKKIYRIANDKDKLLLLEQNELEQVAMTSCKVKVKEKNLSMEIVNAEYQWDRNKLTFYFKSTKRIDFRELVKELYKTYTTRIWMCAVENKGGKSVVYKHE